MDWDAATHKLTISCCTLSAITKQQALQAIFKAHCYTDQQICWLLAHIYMVRPKLHFVNLLITYYTSKFPSIAQQIEPIKLEP